MPNPFHLLGLQLDLEGKAFNPDGYLVQTRAVPDEGPLRVCAVDFGDTHCTFFGKGIPKELEKALQVLPFGAFFEDPEGVLRILERDRPCPGHGHYVTYLFPEALQGTTDPHVHAINPSDARLESLGGGFYRGSASPVFAFLEGNQVLSACISIRESDQAGELWVLTLPGARRRGCARCVALAWQQHLKAHGKIPFYSHEYRNTPSQRLAESLGLIKVYEQAGFE